jgi:hypothetical protein
MNITMEWYIGYATRAVLVVLGMFIFFAVSIYLSSLWGAPWVISTKKTIRYMLEMADLKPGETVLDLGSGDGRILILAAKEFNAKGIGYEIDPIRTLISKIFIWRRGLSNRIKIRWANIFRRDLPEADVVTLYLTRETNFKLKKKLENDLKPGTRVISNGFTIPGWKAAKIDNQNLLFLYIIGLTGEDLLTDFS